MSYKQSQSAYPYFLYSGGGTGTTNITAALANNTTFFNTNTLESGTTGFTNGTFTAPMKGLYFFRIVLNCINNNSAADDSGTWGFRITRSGTPENRIITDNPGNKSTANVEYVTQFSTIAYLNAGDTVRGYSIDFADVEIYLTNQNYFMGYLIAAFS